MRSPTVLDTIQAILQSRNPTNLNSDKAALQSAMPYLC